MNSLQSTDDRERNRAFREHKENNEQMVHRLRNWEEGQIVWGFDAISEESNSGKTFTRSGVGGRSDDDPEDHTGHSEAQGAYRNARKQASEGTALFLWVARIQSVWTGSRDGGEPPLKYADLTSVRILKSEVVGDE